MENLKGVYVARLMAGINKYKPGMGNFLIPAIMDPDSPVKRVTNNNTIALANQGDQTMDITSTTTVQYISISIPNEVVWFYPAKVIPAGTIFFVMFIGGDINKPIIVGRDINGYIDTEEHDNG